MSQIVGNHREPLTEEVCSTLIFFKLSYQTPYALKKISRLCRSQDESSSTDRVADWVMARSTRGKPEEGIKNPKEGRTKRRRTSFAVETSHQATSIIAKSAGAKGTYTYEQTLRLFGVRRSGEIVKYVSNLDPGLVATKLSQWYSRVKPKEATLQNKLCSLLFISWSRGRFRNLFWVYGTV